MAALVGFVLKSVDCFEFLHEKNVLKDISIIVIHRHDPLFSSTFAC